MKLRRRIINETKGDPRKQKAVALAICIKRSCGRNSTVKDYNPNKIQKLTGISPNTFTKYLPTMVEMGLVRFDGKNGDKVLAVFSVDNSSVIETEWNKVMAVVNDDDLVDEKAREAIGMNEKVREKYAQTLKAIDDERMEKEFERLGSVYKVVKK